MTFLDVKTDYAFKKVFGSKESKGILISFLNAIVDFNNNETIVDLTIEDPYNIPKLKGMKDTFVDVKVTLGDKSTVIIEMQVLNHDGFEKRILYNTAKNYAEQLERGDQYHLLNPVIALTIVNFEMFEFEKYKSNFKLLEKEQLTSYTDDIELIFIELPKFKKELEACENIEDKWLYFIKHSEDLSVIPKDVNTPIHNAYEIANTANYSKDELELQRKRKEFIYIQRNSIEKAKREGHEEGHREGHEVGHKQGHVMGHEQGVHETNMKNAMIMIKEFNLSIEDVSKKLGLSIEEIRKYLDS